MRAPSRPSRFPIAVALELSRGASAAAYVYTGVGNVAPPPDPGVEIRAGDQAREAYAAAMERMFERAAPQATLEIAEISADLDFDDDGWHAVVEHLLVLRGRDGVELGRWRTKGRELIVGLGPRSMPAAFARAAEQAARRFEATFEEPAGVAAWLGERGAAPRGPPPPPAEAPPPAPPPPRGYAAYVDAGVGLFLFESGGMDPTSAATEALSLRTGVSAPWAFAQLRMTGAQPQGAASIRAVALEAGPVLRLSQDIELVAGLGACHVQAGGSTRTAATVFGGIRVAKAVSASGARVRLGLEAREDFGEMFRLEGQLGAISVVPAGSVSVLLGLER